METSSIWLCVESELSSLKKTKMKMLNLLVITLIFKFTVYVIEELGKIAFVEDKFEYGCHSREERVDLCRMCTECIMHFVTMIYVLLKCCVIEK